MTKAVLTALLAVAGIGTLAAQDGTDAEVSGIVLRMGKDATAATLPEVSGSLGGGITLCNSTLVGLKNTVLQTQVECSPFYNMPSDYKRSFYAPAVTLSGVGSFWTWSITFNADTDLSLSLTQVAFFSCDVSRVKGSTYESDYPILYTFTLSENAASSPLTLATADGTATMVGAENTSAAGFDFSTGQITAGSGAMVTADWTQEVRLQQGHTYTYSMTVYGADASASHDVGIGFGGIRFVPKDVSGTMSGAIPESSTGTISILSLILSLSRRRRRA